MHLRRPCRSIMLGLALFVAPAPAAVASDASVIEAFGILGVWAIDCSQPPSGENAHIERSVTSAGKVHSLWRYDDKGGGDLAELVDMEPRGTDAFALTNINLRNGNRFRVVLQKRDDKTRSIESTGSDGKKLISDGKFVASGLPTPSFTRCAQKPVS